MTNTHIPAVLTSIRKHY